MQVHYWFGSPQGTKLRSQPSYICQLRYPERRRAEVQPPSLLESSEPGQHMICRPRPSGALLRSGSDPTVLSVGPAVKLAPSG